MSGTRSNARLSIAPMRREDLEGILAIESVSYPRPWTREVFEDETHRGWAYVDVLREAESPAGGDENGAAERVLGYVNYWLVNDEVHVLNVAVHPAARRRGLGARLLDRVLAFSSEHRCRLVTLEVRRSNRPALGLYRRHRFRPVGLRPRYYEDGEDAIVMLRELLAAPATASAT